jgi:hypothetical protein
MANIGKLSRLRCSMSSPSDGSFFADHIVRSIDRLVELGYPTASGAVLQRLRRDFDRSRVHDPDADRRPAYAARSLAAGSTQSLKGAPSRTAPGLRASTGM